MQILGMELKPAKEAFEEALRDGRLTLDESEPNYAGNYMYMGTFHGVDGFKHIDTRNYLKRGK